MMKRNANQGRHYQISEWVDFEIDGLLDGEAQERNVDLDDLREAVQHSKELERARKEFTKQAVRVVTKWMKANPEQALSLSQSDDVESEDDIAWNTWASIVGHGVGFWEHMSSEEYASLKRAIWSDRKLQAAHGELESQIWETVSAAVRRVVDEAVDEIEENPLPARGDLPKLKHKLLR